MRTTKDRIRHLVLFEVTGLLILVPIGAVFFGFDPFEIGALGASTAAIATLLAQNHLTSELLRTLSRMAASKPTSWLSARPHILSHLAHA